EMEGKSSGGSKQTPTKNLDVPVTKGELGNEIKRIMLEHLPTILAQSQENFRKAEEARKAAEETEKKKKANEEVERRRKAMEDKRVAEEQERKRKAEQDRKNAEDVERLTNEEAERRRRNAEDQGDGCSYKSFLNCKPSKFHRDSDPVIVTNWLRVIEDIFEISECSDRQRVKYASHLLKGEAQNIGPKYTAKFNEKARFTKYQTYIPIQEAVKIALMVEKENNRKLEEGGDKKRKRENRDDDVKKIKTNSGKMENVGEYKPCTICKKTYKGEYWHDNCRNCWKSGHTSKECKAEWVCFKCKSPGHKTVDYPERKPHDTQSQKTMGRVFQLTAKNA
ncbi:zinc finger, CCHC-type, retrotransposon gag domain protein, partial [Tanacetum coccineum]